MVKFKGLLGSSMLFSVKLKMPFTVSSLAAISVMCLGLTPSMLSVTIGLTTYTEKTGSFGVLYHRRTSNRSLLIIAIILSHSFELYLP